MPSGDFDMESPWELWSSVRTTILLLLLLLKFHSNLCLYSEARGDWYSFKKNKMYILTTLLYKISIGY